MNDLIVLKIAGEELLILLSVGYFLQNTVINVTVVIKHNDFIII